MFIIDRPDSTEKRPQLPDSPFRLGPHNWLQRIFAQTGILSLSGSYKEEEEGRGQKSLCRAGATSPVGQVSTGPLFSPSALTADLDDYDVRGSIDERSTGSTELAA